MRDETQKPSVADEEAHRLAVQAHIARAHDSVGKRILYRLQQRMAAIIVVGGSDCQWSQLHDGYAKEAVGGKFIRIAVGNGLDAGAWYSIMEVAIEHIFKDGPTLGDT